VLGDWERVTQDRSEVIFPGQVFLLETSCGGYDLKRGWTGDPNDSDFQPVLVEKLVEDGEAPSDEDDDSDELSVIARPNIELPADLLQQNRRRLLSVVESWLNIEQHTRDVCLKLEGLLADVTGLASTVSPRELKVLRLAACWHDRGKGHAAFQAKIDPDVLRNLSGDVLAKLGRESVAKAPKGAWRRGSSKASTSAAANDGVEQDVETTRQTDARRPKFRHELASALAILETLWRANAKHLAFAWPDGLTAAEFSRDEAESLPDAECQQASRLIDELKLLKPDEVDLLVYLVAAHHGKVRMSLRSVPEDLRNDLPNACPPEMRQARGVRDNDPLPKCRLPGTDDANAGWTAPQVTLHLDPMELGLSGRYGASWRERTQRLLERLGPFHLAYLESLLRIADCRASAEEDAAAKLATAKEPHQ
jgi:CRISPR-associated endonuclease/helicase Cas3